MKSISDEGCSTGATIVLAALGPDTGHDARAKGRRTGTGTAQPAHPVAAS